MTAHDVLCFHCSRPIGDPPQLNEMADGEPCPICSNRVLEDLPPIFHMPLEVADGMKAPAYPKVAEEPTEETGLRLVEDDPDEIHPA